jgi:AcrR family transcriptional regulator
MGRNGRAADHDARRVESLADESAAGQRLSEPRGRSDGHPDDVARARIVGALVALAGEHGYARTSVSRVLELARVPSSTFYELFSDRHECFLAAFEAELERVSAHVRDAYDAGLPWRERTRRGLTALLELLQEEPKLARLLVVDSLEAGDRVLGRRARVLAELAGLVEAGRKEASDGHGIALSAEEVVHAAVSVVEARIRASGTIRLAELANALMAMLVLPYHGLPASARELTVPLPTGEPDRKRTSPRPAYIEPDPRISPRSLELLRAVGEAPDASNRALSRRTGVADEGQISRMLGRLEQMGLVSNRRPGRAGRNAWTLCAKGAQLLSATPRPLGENAPKPRRSSPKPPRGSTRRQAPG